MSGQADKGIKSVQINKGNFNSNKTVSFDLIP